MNTQNLKKRIEQTRELMGREWRLYGRCSTALRKLELQLQAKLNLEAATVRKKLINRSRQIWSYLEQKAQALKDANYVAFLAVYMPRVYDWGISDDFETIDNGA